MNSVSELSPEEIVPYLNAVSSRYRRTTFSPTSGNKEWEISFSDAPELDLTEKGLIVYRDYLVKAEAGQLSLQITENSNHYRKPRRNTEHSLTFFRTQQLTHRLPKPDTGVKKNSRFDYRTLAGLSRIDDFPYFVNAEMPRFPGCENERKITKRKACAQRELLSYIYRNVKYPPSARENREEGTVVISFDVNGNSSTLSNISNIRLIRGVSDAVNEEALRVVAQMYYEELRWIPGVRDGTPVDAVQFNLPIKFQL